MKPKVLQTDNILREKKVEMEKKNQWKHHTKKGTYGSEKTNKLENTKKKRSTEIETEPVEVYI